MPYHIGESSSCPTSKPHAVIKDGDGDVLGCHSTRESAERQIAAIHASEGKDTVEELALASPNVTGSSYVTDVDAAAMTMTGTPWEGILVVEGVETGDGRQFANDAITWVDPGSAVVPLRRNIEDSHGGTPTTRAVLVGRIDEIWRDPERPGYIMGRGVFDDQGEHGAEALRLVQSRFLRGISVDPDDIKDVDVELIFPEPQEPGPDADEDVILEMFMDPELTLFHAGRLRGATLVDIPAFVEAQIWLTSEPRPDFVAASTHFTELSEQRWNGAVHESRLPGQMNVNTARTAYAHVGVSGDSTVIRKTNARFMHHEVTDDGVVGVANLTACGVAMRAINVGRASALSETERRIAYEHMSRHVRTAGMVVPPYEGGSLVASSVPERPPAEWFTNPRLPRLTPLTITDEGRVYGHGAGWKTCHTSFANTCVEAPSEPNGEHVYYRVGEVVCADGSRVAVGTITLGTGHAAVRGLTPSHAAEHYDNTGTAVAYVASGEDDYGIWVSGALRSGLSSGRIAELRASALSGDWRRIGGTLRLVAFLAVNHPGFPVPRTQAFTSQQDQLSLVAAGVVTQDARRSTPSRGVSLALKRLARDMGRDPQSRMDALRQRIGAHSGVRMQ